MQEDFIYTDERFADIQLLRYKVAGFDKLPLRQRTLIYYLSQAALEGRDILWDQNGRYNLRIRKMLELVFTHYQGNRESDNFKKFSVYLKRVWFSNGIHHHYSTDKLPATFSPDFLEEALQNIGNNVVEEETGATIEQLKAEIFPVLFNPQIMPKRVNQAEGADLINTSRGRGFLCTPKIPGKRSFTPCDVWHEQPARKRERSTQRQAVAQRRALRTCHRPHYLLVG